eukprot:TRINITY_DN70185_c0_g1_i1.p1 TRINITY_DN70185_c0_g1~~TRINITY_DN70185_c0_g1_i1.p1  ORF type:complete len:596 (-),score=118.17 TRINITY_DN70185_c0_g1_i1:1-1788(-)
MGGDNSKVAAAAAANVPEAQIVNYSSLLESTGEDGRLHDEDQRKFITISEAPAYLGDDSEQLLARMRAIGPITPLMGPLTVRPKQKKALPKCSTSPLVKMAADMQTYGMKGNRAAFLQHETLTRKLAFAQQRATELQTVLQRRQRNVTQMAVLANSVGKLQSSVAASLSLVAELLSLAHDTYAMLPAVRAGNPSQGESTPPATPSYDAVLALHDLYKGLESQGPVLVQHLQAGLAMQRGVDSIPEDDADFQALVKHFGGAERELTWVAFLLACVGPTTRHVELATLEWMQGQFLKYDVDQDTQLSLEELRTMVGDMMAGSCPSDDFVRQLMAHVGFWGNGALRFDEFALAFYHWFDAKQATAMRADGADILVDIEFDRREFARELYTLFTSLQEHSGGTRVVHLQDGIALRRNFALNAQGKFDQLVTVTDDDPEYRNAVQRVGDGNPNAPICWEAFIMLSMAPFPNPQVHPIALQRLRLEFDKYDGNKDGVIEFSELKAMAADMLAGSTLSDDYIQRLLRDASLWSSSPTNKRKIPGLAFDEVLLSFYHWFEARFQRLTLQGSGSAPTFGTGLLASPASVPLWLPSSCNMPGYFR